jgi:hypothetical protein
MYINCSALSIQVCAGDLTVAAEATPPSPEYELMPVPTYVAINRSDGTVARALQTSRSTQSQQHQALPTSIAFPV